MCTLCSRQRQYTEDLRAKSKPLGNFPARGCSYELGNNTPIKNLKHTSLREHIPCWQTPPIHLQQQYAETFCGMYHCHRLHRFQPTLLASPWLIYASPWTHLCPAREKALPLSAHLLTRIFSSDHPDTVILDHQMALSQLNPSWLHLLKLLQTTRRSQHARG